MKAGWISLFALLFAIFVQSAENNDWQKNTLSFKMIVHVGQNTEYFEYVQPNRYFYINNEYIVTGTKAEKQFHKLFENVQLTEESSLESLLLQLKNSGYEKMNRFEIRWLTANEELYTWVWDSEQTR